MSSDKNFLLTFSVITLVIYLIFKINFFLIITFVFFIFAYVKPNLFHILNYFVFKLGGLFLILIQPIVLRIIFILVFGIIGMIMKLFRYDPLRLKNYNKKSFWLDKKNKIEEIEDLKNQY